MDQLYVMHRVASGLRRCGAFMAAIVLALAATACDSDRKAVPDPQKPPLPKTSQHR